MIWAPSRDTTGSRVRESGSHPSSTALLLSRKTQNPFYYKIINADNSLSIWYLEKPPFLPVQRGKPRRSPPVTDTTAHQLPRLVVPGPSFSIDLKVFRNLPFKFSGDLIHSGQQAIIIPNSMEKTCISPGSKHVPLNRADTCAPRLAQALARCFS